MENRASLSVPWVDHSERGGLGKDVSSVRSSISSSWIRPHPTVVFAETLVVSHLFLINLSSFLKITDQAELTKEYFPCQS